MAPPRFLVDEMLGRLARYLRIVGCDAEYARGVADAAIASRARAEGRVVVTRDRALARSSPGSVLITSPTIDGQWRELRRAVPDVPTAPRVERCTRCNGRLAPYCLGSDPERERGVPADRVARGLGVWACAACGQLYWDGSHLAGIRTRLERWSAGAPA